MVKIETDGAFDLTTPSKKLLLEYLNENITKPYYRILAVEGRYLMKLIKNDLEDKLKYNGFVLKKKERILDET